jgi:hypothetical protein
MSSRRLLESRNVSREPFFIFVFGILEEEQSRVLFPCAIWIGLDQFRHSAEDKTGQAPESHLESVTQPTGKKAIPVLCRQGEAAALLYTSLRHASADDGPALDNPKCSFTCCDRLRLRQASAKISTLGRSSWGVRPSQTGMAQPQTANRQKSLLRKGKITTVR